MSPNSEMFRKYSAITIADYLIEKAKSEGKHLSPLKVMKLVYFAYGWYLSLTGAQLINEPVEAWQYGPVIPSIYHAFKRYGNREITDYVPNRDDLIQLKKQSDQIAALLDRIWDVYGDYSAIQLSNMTHETDSPWDIAWNTNHGKYFNNHVIPDELIKKYFNSLSANENSQQGFLRS